MAGLKKLTFLENFQDLYQMIFGAHIGFTIWDQWEKLQEFINMN